MNSNVKPSSLDLNLLVVFDVMVKDRNVTQAARRVGLSQPAMSSALNRLRRAFGDPLFVRTVDGMMPTPYAQHRDRGTRSPTGNGRLAGVGPRCRRRPQGPLPSMAKACRDFASWMSQKASPPRPTMCGIATPSVAAAAMAASTAEPPSRRTSSDAWEPSGCAVATMPCSALQTARVGLVRLMVSAPG